MRTATAIQLLSLMLATLCWFGCDPIVAPIEEKDERTSNLENRSRTLVSTKKEPKRVPPAIAIEPADGTFFTDRAPSGLAVTFSGFTTEPGQTVEVQVLAAGASVANGNWVTIATAATATTETTFNDADPIFRWEVRAVPSSGAEWPSGGLVRFRTVAVGNGERTLLPFYDVSAGDCAARVGEKSWKTVLKTCKSPFSPELGAKLGSSTKAASLVSSFPKPGDDFFPNYLSRKGYIEEEETVAYYDAIAAPPTLADFADRFGFNADDLFDGDGDQASALYYNNGDLAIGREIHCRSFVEDGEQGTACITRNYGVLDDGTPDFSGDPDQAMRDAIDNVNSFAAVCMVKFGTKFNGAPNDVQFIVYDAQGELANRAGLDTFTSNDAIPNNCLNCHGGIYDRRNSVVIGASFLPYDPEAFLFSNEPGFTYEDQEDEFRKLNVLVRNAGPPPGTLQFINGLYGDEAEVEGTKSNLDWIPSGWASTQEGKTMYREVYKQFCRTCHTSQVGDYGFLTYEDFKAEGAKSLQGACIGNDMPVAEATMNHLWRSPARAYLLNSLEGASSCSPVGDF
ncbi:MAG: hypothetical protein KIT84_11715 [Labilithrix sp.]|nr:hypothetical protein [Labilithrix sp.]MCW5811677.1 hypothetical protein [Labilithrix sp.]